MGLVSQLVEEDNAIPAALKMAESIAKLPPVALEQIKEVALMAEDVPLHAGRRALNPSSYSLIPKTRKKACRLLLKNENQIIRVNNSGIET